jgi:uncharacterized protein
MAIQSIAPQPASALRGFVRRHPLSAFFGLAFGISWLFLIADALGSRGLIPFRLTLSGPGLLLVLLMSYGPTFAALIVAWATEGLAGVRTLLGRLVPWRASLRWYILALGAPAVFFFVTSTLQGALGATLQPPPGPMQQVLLAGLAGSLLHAIANGEELGWRGYALPQLLARYSALQASLLLGAIWFAFHTPIMFTVGGVAGSQTLDSALPFLVSTLALSVVITWMFMGTHGGVLPIILLHGALNTWPGLFIAYGGHPAVALVQLVPMVLLAAIVVLRYGPTRFARMRNQPEALHPGRYSTQH